VQEQRQSSSSEMIGRTSDSVQCSTARRDGEQSNQAPAQPGAGASPCCEAASWVQGSSPGRGVVPGHSRCFTWAVVRRATTFRGTMRTMEHGPGRGRDAACVQPHRDAFLGHSCRLMGGWTSSTRAAARPCRQLVLVTVTVTVTVTAWYTVSVWPLRPASPPMPNSTSRAVYCGTSLTAQMLPFAFSPGGPGVALVSQLTLGRDASRRLGTRATKLNHAQGVALQPLSLVQFGCLTKACRYSSARRMLCAGSWRVRLRLVSSLAAVPGCGSGSTPLRSSSDADLKLKRSAVQPVPRLMG
jgi:hypothetical protein